jgi:hypothetical protein
MRPQYRDSNIVDPYEKGCRYQDFICDELADASPPIIIQNYCSEMWQVTKGENRQGIEIKNDDRHRETGRMSFEIGERKNLDRPWVKSGIYSPSLYYLQGDYRHALLFKTAVLRAYVEQMKPEIVEHNPPTIRKFYIGVMEARRLAERIFYFDERGQ